MQGRFLLSCGERCTQDSLRPGFGQLKMSARCLDFTWIWSDTFGGELPTIIKCYVAKITPLNLKDLSELYSILILRLAKASAKAPATILPLISTGLSHPRRLCNALARLCYGSSSEIGAMCRPSSFTQGNFRRACNLWYHDIATYVPWPGDQRNGSAGRIECV